jgi:outer membrane cobalamin receptor
MQQKRLFLEIGGICVALMLSCGAAVAQVRHFDIPKGGMDKALDAYSKQAGVPVVYRVDDVRNMTTDGVSGDLDANATLKKILEHSGLTVQHDSSGAIAIVKPAGSRSSNAGQSKPTAGADTQNLDSVVVTGNAAYGGVKKLDASYSVTSLTEEQISQANTTSANDLLKASPGIHVESSGGQSGANIEVAGFPGADQSPYVTIALEGIPLYPMAGLRFAEEGTFLRLDDTIAKAEFVQGGPGVLYGNAQPGLFANFLLKQGTDAPSGDVGVTVGSEGMYRLDGFVGFPIGEGSGWYGSIGGFWRSSDGVRDPQFKADEGGQLTGTLTRNWDDGSLMFYARYLNDKNQFVTDTPILNPSRGQFSDYPGFDPLTGTMGSKADQYEFLQTTPCNTSGCTPGGYSINLADGRGPKALFTGATFDWDFGNGWVFSDKLGFSAGSEYMVALYSTGTNPLPLSAYIAGKESADNLPSGLTAIANYANGGGPADMNQNVVPQELRRVSQQFHSVSNEAHISKELFDGNTLTIGNYTASYNSTEIAYQGAQILLQAVSNPNPISVALTNGTNTWQLASSQGFVLGPQTALLVRGQGFNTAFFVSDNWKIGDWLFDAGIRDEYQHLTSYSVNGATGDLDDDPYSLYNNVSRYLVNSETGYYYGKTAPSWTIGINYEFDSNMSAYARVSDGVHFPSFTDITSLAGVPVNKIHNMELGFKYQADWIYASLTGYRRLFYNVPANFLVAVDGVSSNATFLYGSATNGLNMQVTLKPFENFSVALSGDVMDGKYTHSNGCVTFQGTINETVCNASYDFDGNQLQRQPSTQGRLTPAYTLPTSWGSLTGWVTYEYIGSHYGDQLEQQPLGHYYDLAFGVVADVGTNWQLRLQGTNVTNQIGITEGNARILGAATVGGVILARSIEGREINFQVKYKF